MSVLPKGKNARFTYITSPSFPRTAIHPLLAGKEGRQIAFNPNPGGVDGSFPFAQPRDIWIAGRGYINACMHACIHAETI